MKKRLFRLYSYLVPILIILGQYYVLVPALQIGMIILFVFGFYISIVTRELVFDRFLLYFVFYIAIQELCLLFFEYLYVDINVLFNKNISILWFSLILVFISSHVQLSYLLKSYTFIAIVISIVLIYQFFSFHLFRIVPWNGKIPFLKSVGSWANYAFRPNSVFSEPSAYILYIIPLIVIKLIQGKYKISLFLSITCFLSTSSTGVILVAIIWIWQLINFIRIKKTINPVRIFIFIFFFIAISIIFLFISGFLEYTIDKVKNIDIKENDRLLKGVVIYRQLPIFMKIIGVGIGNLKNYTDFMNIYLSFKIMGTYTIESEFTNAISYSFLTLGFGGGCFFIFFIYNHMLHLKGNYKMFLVIISIFYFVTQIFFNNYFIFHFLLIFLISDKKGYKLKIA